MNRLWDPYNPENIKNPYQMYDRLRREAPVYQSQTGEWILTRYDDVFQVLGQDEFIVGNRLDWMKRQQQHLQDDRVDFQAIIDAMHSFLILLNPPQHTHIRSLVSKAWSDHNVENIIKENIDSLISSLPDEFDLIKDFATPLPVMTICRIMGIELGEYKRLKGLSESMLQSLNLYTSLKQLVTISESATTYIEFFKEYISFRRGNLSDDLVSKVIINNQHNEQPLADDELISICIFLFIAGEETTVNLIGNGVLTLLNDQEAWIELAKNPLLCAEAINEILRYDPPVQVVGRIATTDYEIGDKIIPRGSTVTLAIGGANRDPAKFENPDRFSFHRSFKQHVSFGRGKHFCLGAWLAKVQGELALSALVEYFPTLKLRHQELRWNNHLAVRGLKSLEVTK